MAKNSMEAFRDNLIFRGRHLRTTVNKKHNYNAIISLCIRAMTMALRLMIGDSK